LVAHAALVQQQVGAQQSLCEAAFASSASASSAQRQGVHHVA